MILSSKETILLDVLIQYQSGDTDFKDQDCIFGELSPDTRAQLFQYGIFGNSISGLCSSLTEKKYLYTQVEEELFYYIPKSVVQEFRSYIASNT